MWALFQKIIRESAEDIHSALQGWVSILEWFDYERMFLGYYLQSKSYPFSFGRTKKKALELHIVRAALVHDCKFWNFFMNGLNVLRGQKGEPCFHAV